MMSARFLPLAFLLPVLLPAAAPPAPDLVFAEASDWEVVSGGHQFAEGMAWDAVGHFYFTDVPRGQLFRVDRATGAKTLLDGATGRANGIAFGPDGRLYGCASGDRCIYAWDPATWQKVKVAEGTASNDLVILRDGTIFYTDPQPRLVWRLEARTFTRSAAAKLDWGPNGIAVSRDERTLLVAEFAGDTVHGFPLGADSRITGPSRPAHRLAVPSDGRGFLDGMTALAGGRLLIGTSLGAQVVPSMDGAGGGSRHLVIPSPQGRPRCNYIRVSPGGEWLYAAHVAEVLRRRLRPEALER